MIASSHECRPTFTGHAQPLASRVVHGWPQGPLTDCHDPTLALFLVAQPKYTIQRSICQFYKAFFLHKDLLKCDLFVLHALPTHSVTKVPCAIFLLPFHMFTKETQPLLHATFEAFLILLTSLHHTPIHVVKLHNLSSDCSGSIQVNQPSLVTLCLSKRRYQP